MGEVQQRFLAALTAVAILAPAGAAGQKFYRDDPLWQMPQPMDASGAVERKLEELYEFLYMTFGKPAAPVEPVAAGATNTLGEVPDSLWYTNRHGKKRMSIDELVRGPGNSTPPSPRGAWRVVAAKTEGVTPGFTIKDSTGQRYQIKFDWQTNFELPTGADVMGSKFFHALGYFTPENYIVYFNAEQLTVQPGTRLIDYRGVDREMKQSDIIRVLQPIPRDPRTGQYRAVASRFLEGKPLGPFRYHGLRTDDPNDIVPHQNRRDLRGLKVFAGWLQHTDTKPLNSLDMLVEQNGRKVIRHHLIDFSASFGTDAFEPKSPRAGNVHMLDWPDAAKSFFSFGLYMPAWSRADYKHKHGVGRIESETFRPDDWKSHYYNPAFANCLPDDAFWAAKQVMRFTEPEIRALVATAQYSDAEAVDYLVKVLIERQRRIGQWAFAQVLPLDNFVADRGSLRFEDLGVTYRFTEPQTYKIGWSNFDNASGQSTSIAGASGSHIPSGRDGYLLATLDAGEPAKQVRVYLLRRGGSVSVVGIERGWRAPSS
ncbi:MAG TPA: hypothetical protein VES20_09155 [Bryobacteraceae bacterium]|nr:hypothetical protein [Bryobacteraceae bacterium]